jgi:hypothetical protein
MKKTILLLLLISSICFAETIKINNTVQNKDGTEYMVQYTVLNENGTPKNLTVNPTIPEKYLVRVAKTTFDTLKIGMVYRVNKLK